MALTYKGMQELANRVEGMLNATTPGKFKVEFDSVKVVVKNQPYQKNTLYSFSGNLPEPEIMRRAAVLAREGF